MSDSTKSFFGMRWRQLHNDPQLKWRIAAAHILLEVPMYRGYMDEERTKYVREELMKLELRQA